MTRTRPDNTRTRPLLSGAAYPDRTGHPPIRVSGCPVPTERKQSAASAHHSRHYRANYSAQSPRKTPICREARQHQQLPAATRDSTTNDQVKNGRGRGVGHSRESQKYHRALLEGTAATQPCAWIRAIASARG
jgi:hypothetical protein